MQLERAQLKWSHRDVFAYRYGRPGLIEVDTYRGSRPGQLGHVGVNELNTGFYRRQSGTGSGRGLKYGRAEGDISKHQYEDQNQDDRGESNRKFCGDRTIFTPVCWAPPSCPTRFLG